MNNLSNLITKLSTINTIHLVMAISIFAVLYILSPLFSYIIIKFFNWKKSSKEIKDSTFYKPIKVFFKVSGIYLAILFLRYDLNFSNEFIEVITKVYKILVTITIATSLANSITKKSLVIKKIKEKSDKEINDSATKILVRVVRILIYVIAAFIVFAELGYDLSGLVTGLGLGSVVLTLAAQDTIKNLLGGIIIFMDKPFLVGESIKFLSYQGTVEDMTLRSTRIRLLDNSIAQIPNSLISSDSVVNLSKMQKRLYKLRLQIDLNTEMEKIEFIEKNINNILLQNENIIQDSINIHFTEVETNGYTIETSCFFNTTDYMKYLDIKEELNKKIIKVVKEQNVRLAYDTKILEIKNK